MKKKDECKQKAGVKTEQEQEIKSAGKAGQMLANTDRKAEEAYLQKTMQVIRKNIASYEAAVAQMQEQIDEMLDHYHDNDVELYTALSNTVTMQDNMNYALLKNQKAMKKPYFGRIIFHDETMEKEESLYIGRGGIAKDTTHQMVIDWRAPVANAYYENGLGKCSYLSPEGKELPIDLKLKRTYEIEEGRLLDYFDTEVIANDDLLTKYLAKNKQAVLGEIIATIQKEQNEVIRKSPYHNMIVQGVAGSGKTTVAMHRISFILYNYAERFKPDDFYIVGSNRILLEYITGVLPDLDVYGIRQMTMEQLFVRLLYEDWDEKKYRIKENTSLEKGSGIRGTYAWYCDLQKFCARLEQEVVSAESIYLNPRQFVEGFKNGKTGIFDETVGKPVKPEDLIEIISGKDVKNYIRRNASMSIQSKINMLNERLLVKIKDEFLKNPMKYTYEEKKAIQKAYRGRYGKNEWSGSIFALYQEFLTEQSAKGYQVKIPEDSFDVYDLAALAYLYKRVKETEVISEAHHVVIDEAQDFGMMAYCVLKFCIKDCTYTIMGDVSQNIHFGYGLNDWEELKGLMLSGDRDYFGILKKSYRNTVEIAEFALGILHHGKFAAYPAEPIIRHGNPVEVKACRGRKEMLQKAAEVCRSWQEKGLDTIAVICRNEKDAQRTASGLSAFITVEESDPEKAVYANGVMVLPVAYTKGLEFDAVLILDPDNEDYPADDGHAKLLYVAATRALHELCVLHIGDLTDLIAKPAEEKQDSLRDKVQEDLQTENEAVAEVESAVLPSQPKAAVSRRKVVATVKSPKPVSLSSQTMLLTGVRSENRPKVEIKRPATKLETMFGSDYGHSGGRRSYEADSKRLKRRDGGALRDEKTPCFGDMPSAEYLSPGGRAKADLSVKWSFRQPDGLYMQSRDGVLRISPITSEIIRITFVAKGQPKESTCPGIALSKTEKAWMYKDMPSVIELTTDDLLLQVDKKSGAITYMDRKKKVLLKEKENGCRRIDENQSRKRAWLFSEWKKDILSCPGMAGGAGLKLNGKAYYISDGKAGKELPFVLSDKGYGILMATKKPVVCCNIPAYGSYLSAEDGELDYYFVVGKNQKELLDSYGKLCGL